MLQGNCFLFLFSQTRPSAFQQFRNFLTKQGPVNLVRQGGRDANAIFKLQGLYDFLLVSSGQSQSEAFLLPCEGSAPPNVCSLSEANNRLSVSVVGKGSRFVVYQKLGKVAFVQLNLSNFV